MSKLPSEEKKLPERYPRDKEILIFGDMSELNHVSDLLDRLKENLYSLLPDVTDDKWWDTINFSVVNHLITELRKACYEFERFWQDDGWKPEDDKEFMDYMNDPDELQWLVTDLDFGRIKDVDGKLIRYYEPGYHAAARSLQMAMYIKCIPGDEDWIDYCIKELRYNLIRYHAAALEIAMHRENVYLHNNELYLKKNESNIQTGRKIREKSRDQADAKKAEANSGYRKRYVECVEKIIAESGKGKNNAVVICAKREGVSIRTIYRAFEAIEKLEKNH